MGVVDTELLHELSAIAFTGSAVAKPWNDTVIHNSSATPAVISDNVELWHLEMTACELWNGI